MFSYAQLNNKSDHRMYSPKGNGKDKSFPTVQFSEAEPPQHLRGVVHRFLDLKTDGELHKDYEFHALPDACTYLVFDQHNVDVTGVSKLRAESQEFNLGRTFHFVNIRFLPGVWLGDLEQIAYGLVDTPYAGDLPLKDLNAKITGLEFENQQELLCQFVETLIEQGLLAPNPAIENILNNLDDIHNVADMAEISKLSTRQLQRTLKRTTGFPPHDFLKILRLQQSINGQDIWSYADQSHFINSFRKATGYSPSKYSKKYDV